MLEWSKHPPLQLISSSSDLKDKAERELATTIRDLEDEHTHKTDEVKSRGRDELDNMRREQEKAQDEAKRSHSRDLDTVKTEARKEEQDLRDRLQSELEAEKSRLQETNRASDG